MEYIEIDDKDGAIYTIINDSNQVTAHIPAGVNREDKLRDVAKHTIARFQRNDQTFQPDVARSENAKFVYEWLLGAMRANRNDLHSDKRRLVERRERLRQPISSDIADLNFERTYIASLTDKPFVELASKLNGELDTDRTSALLRHNDLLRLTSDAGIIAHVESEHAINLIVETHGTTFAFHPTLETPLPIGIDLAAARADAAERLAILDREIEAADDAGKAWTSIVALAAAASGLAANDIFARIIG